MGAALPIISSAEGGVPGVLGTKVYAVDTKTSAGADVVVTFARSTEALFHGA